MLMVISIAFVSLIQIKYIEKYLKLVTKYHLIEYYVTLQKTKLINCKKKKKLNLVLSIHI